jgi:hypothetical protein
MLFFMFSSIVLSCVTGGHWCVTSHLNRHTECEKFSTSYINSVLKNLNICQNNGVYWYSIISLKLIYGLAALIK